MAKVVDCRAGNQACAGSGTIDEGCNLGSGPTSDRRSGDGDGKGCRVVNRQGKFVIGAGDDGVALTNRTIQDACVCRNLITQVIRDQRICTVEIVGHPHVIRRGGLDRQAQNATGTIHAQNNDGDAVDRNGNRSRIGRRGTCAIPRHDGEITDLNAIISAVECAKRHLTRWADAGDSATGLIFLDNTLVYRRGRTANQLHCRLRQDLRPGAEDQWYACCNAGPCIGGVEVRLCVNTRRCVDSRREGHVQSPKIECKQSMCQYPE